MENYGSLYIVSVCITGADSQYGDVVTKSLMDREKYFKKCNNVHFSVVFEAAAFLGRTVTSSLTGSLTFSCICARLSGRSRMRLICKEYCWQPRVTAKSVVPHYPNKKSGAVW